MLRREARAVTGGKRMPSAAKLPLEPWAAHACDVGKDKKGANMVADQERGSQAAKTSHSPFSTLAQLTAAEERLCGTSSRVALIDTFLASAIELHGSNLGNLYLLDPDTRTLAIAAQRTFPEVFLQAFRAISLDGDSFCGRALRVQNAVVVEDVEREPGYAPFRRIAAAARYRAVQSTPVVSSRGEPIGVISTYFERPHRPSEDEMMAMALFARHAADQIARLRLEDALKAAEERQWLLAREMDHRFGNVFGIVQSIARQMQRVAPTPAVFVQGFNERIAAFAHAQTLLTESDWRGAKIGALAHKQLMVEAGDPSLVCEGASLDLPANAALVLALALHELGTNARKYGAWTASGGRVTLSWHVEPNDDGDTLALRWRESGGPRVMPPTHEGFGSTLLRRAFVAAGGRMPTLRFEPDGVVCDMHLPLHGSRRL